MIPSSRPALLMLICAVLYCGALHDVGAGEAPAALHTRNVILITVDGLRVEELFQGVDPKVLSDNAISGVEYEEEVTRVRDAYARRTPAESREALMPFFWKTLVPQGVIVGNRELGSRAQVKNKEWFSAPGYAELLTGEPHAEITRNDLIRYPHRTVLEFAQENLRLGYTDVAVVGSWEGFATLSASRAGTFFSNTGHEAMPPRYATPKMDAVTEIQSEIMTLWPESRSDAVTLTVALEYLRTQQPRLLYLALDDSDSWAHQRRYDRYLDYMNVFDRQLSRLWQLLQGLDAYRDRTTLIITTDHGRGSRPADWIEHGAGIEGSQDIWIAVIGPDTPDRGELTQHAPVSQSDVAATIARCFGLDFRKFNPNAGPPLPMAFEGH